MSTGVENLGRPGIDFRRSEGRAYFNVPERMTSLSEVIQQYQEFAQQGKEVHRRRRVVFRVRCSGDVADQLSRIDRNVLPVEVMLPLETLDTNTQDFLVTIGENIHASEIPEWSNVYSYWRQPNGDHKTPLNRLERLDPQRLLLTNQLTEADEDCLLAIWRPFGWTREGVQHFIRNYRNEGKFFSGVIDRTTNCLVSACMAEGMGLAGLQLVEGTEYGTLPGHEGQGYCTAAVVGLHAQILEQSRASESDQLPLILSEFSMTSRSDIVGRHTGMTVPLVEGVQGLEQTPIQVLRYNVSILDRRPVNSIRWQDLGDQRQNYRNAYRTTHRYWRNFIVGMLTSESIEQNYSPEQTAAILSRFETRSTQ